MSRSIKKGPFVDAHLIKRWMRLSRQRQEADQNLVASFHGPAGIHRPDDCRPQRLPARSPFTSTRTWSVQVGRVRADPRSRVTPRTRSRRGKRWKLPPLSVVFSHRLRRPVLVADLIRGKSVAQALNILTFSPKKAAVILKKAVESAIANAEHNDGADIDELKVTTILWTRLNR